MGQLVRGHGTCWTSLLGQVLIQSPPCAVNRGAYHYYVTLVAQWQNEQREKDSNQRVGLPVFGDCELVMVTGASPQVDRWYRADST